MKPIIVEMEDLSDSMEIYNSKPRTFVTGFIYIVAGMLIAFLVWMYHREVDVVVEAKGTFHHEMHTEEIYSGVSGKIMECNIEEGVYVREGDILFSTDIDYLHEEIETYEKYLAVVEEQLKTLGEYRQKMEEACESQDEPNHTSEEMILVTGIYDINLKIAEYEEKKYEYENEIKKLQKECESSIVRAGDSGYISMNTEIKEGLYVEEGVNVCQIICNQSEGNNSEGNKSEENDNVENNSTKNNRKTNNSETDSENIVYADIYVNSSDITKLKCGQKVRFEIRSYPANEYGYFTGCIESIGVNVKYDDYGKAYYEVKVACDTKNLTDKHGKEISIMNGMECEAKIIVGRKSVMKYLLEQ